MKLPIMYTIIEKISNSIADGRKAIWAIYEAEDNIFTQAYSEPQQAEKLNHESFDSRDVENKKTVILKMMQDNEPHWL